jgi:transposase
VGNTRRQFDPEFRAGAVRIVTETNKPSQGAVTESKREELAQLRAEKTRWDKEKAELEMERDVLSAPWSCG